jgi:hypothetical protein
MTVAFGGGRLEFTAWPEVAATAILKCLVIAGVFGVK